MNIDEELANCIGDLGYRELTNLQRKVFEIATNTTKSIIVVAPTGSGKTEAALFPIMYTIRSRKLNPIAAMYVTPLRALNRNIEERLLKIAKCFEVRIALRHGDTPQALRKAIERDPPHILITTPESLNYVVINERLRKYLANLEFIVIDEFKELLESKRGYLLFTVIYLLERTLLKRRVRKVALTATLKNDYLARSVLSASPYASDVLVVRDEQHSKEMEIQVVVAPKDLSKEYGVDRVIYDRELASKVAYLIDVLRKYRGVLVFTNTRSLAEKFGFVLSRVREALKLEDVSVGVHHGSLSRSHRLSVEEEFKRGLLRGLVVTSSMELGIDIGRIDYVVQYSSPRQAVHLVQRVGRSGHRLGGTSRGSVLVSGNLFQVLESAVLVRRSTSYDLEEEEKYNSPLDVLAYSIAMHALLHSDGVDLYKLYSELSSYEIYRELDLDVYKSLLEYLNYSRIVRIVNGKIYPSRRTRLYLYRVTMIPDTRNIDVIEVHSGRRVGVLNEEYVVLNVKENSTLVLGGTVWKVVGYSSDEAKLYVEKVEASDEILIPHWEGENIPVEYRVAREVGSVVRRLKMGASLESYSIPRDLHDEIREKATLFGDDRNIIIDYCSEHDIVLINVYGGSRVNRLLRDLIATVLSNRYPLLNVSIHSTPYAILIKFDQRISSVDLESVVELIENTLHGLERYLDLEHLKAISSKHGPLLWRIYQVAQRFGAIDPKASPVSKSILSSFVDTVIGLEALKEVISRDYDVDSARELAKAISRGAIKISKRHSLDLSAFHYELINYIEIPSVEVAKKFDVETYRERVLNRKVTIICIKCGYAERGRVRDFLNMSFSCPKCKYKSLSVTKSDGSVERQVVLKNNSNQRLSSLERKVLETLRSRAVLLIEHGSLALIVLSARGVGLNSAKKVISRARSGENLFEMLYEYEKKLVKAKKYIKKRGEQL